MATAFSTYTWRQTVDVADADGTTHTETFVASTDPARIQTDALRDALASDMLWWAEPLDEAGLQTVVHSSVCMGLYHEATGTTVHAAPKMVGMARLVTDRTTFGYLTDVYVLEPFQRRGLGAWLVRCVRELVAGTGGAASSNGGLDGPLQGWPTLRSVWLLCTTPAAARMYTKALGMELVARYRSQPGVADSGQFLLEMRGPAHALKHYAARAAGASGFK